MITGPEALEGAEELALRGAIDSLNRWHPVVLFESMPLAPMDDQRDRDGAWALLHGMGYALGHVEADGRLVPAEELRVGNNIAVPPHRKDLFTTQ